MENTLTDLDLDPKGNINFFSVGWTTVNKWLSYLNSNYSMHDNIDNNIRDKFNRGHIIKELEDRRQGESFPSQIRVFALKALGRDLCTGLDWTLYHNQEGFTQLEELLIYQPSKRYCTSC